MNEQTINQQHTQILLLIHEKRLKEALYQLESYFWQCSDWNLKNRFEQIQLAYSYMLQYMQEGIADPERKKLYAKIQADTLEVTDQIRLLYLDQQSNHLYHEYRRKQAFVGSNQPQIEKMRLVLESFTDDLAVSCLLNEQHQNEVLMRHEETQKLLFIHTWTNSSWNLTEAEQAKAMLASELVQENDLCLFVSAVTMSLLACFDVRKLLCLFDAYQYSNVQISQRGLVGMAFVLHRYADRLKLYPEIENRLASISEAKPLDEDLMLIQRQILLCQETEKIDKKMREEIIPEMMKNVSSIRNMKFGFEESDEEKDDRNPDWQGIFDTPGLGDKLREMNELQMEGADVNMSTFSALKGFPFFRELHHWFYPFDRKHSSVIKQSKERGGENDFMDIIMQSGLFCNNDKYSLFFIMQNFPQSQRDMVFSQLIEQADGLTDQSKLDVMKKFNDRPTTVSNQYLHDLYRFYKLNQRRMEFNDIFKEKIRLYQVPVLKDLLYHPDFLLNLAHYHLSKEHWVETTELYETVLTMDNRPEITDEFYQRLGYALQKQGRRQEAIAAYLKADTIKPDNVWTNRRLATCYRLTGKFAEALAYYRKVEETAPENKNTVYYIAHCLAELQQYDDALNYFFKLDFLENNSLKAWRGIAWCSFVQGKHEQATKYYEKIIENKPLPIDFLNAGHSYWVSKNMVKAIAMYSKAAELSEGRDLFIETFKKDVPFLIDQGIAKDDIPLMIDLI